MTISIEFGFKSWIRCFLNKRLGFVGESKDETAGYSGGYSVLNNPLASHE